MIRLQNNKKEQSWKSIDQAALLLIGSVSEGSVRATQVTYYLIK